MEKEVLESLSRWLEEDDASQEIDLDEDDWSLPSFDELFPQQAAQVQVIPQKSPSKSAKTVRLLTDILFCLLILGILGGATLFTLSSNPEKSFFGYRIYAVKTPSMTPGADSPSGGFKAGALIAVKLCEAETLQVGDIVTYVPGSEPDVYLTHRVVEILDHLNGDEGLFFVTKGDANDSADPPIAAKAVVGKKVLAIPLVGYALQVLQNNLLLVLIMIISAFGFAILLRMYVAGSPKKKAQKSL